MASQFSVLDFFGRWFISAALVFGTYNPTAYCYASWITSEGMEFGPIPAIVTLLILIAWLVFLNSTYNAIGPSGSFCPPRCSAVSPGCWWI